jgi:hypothetical protein
MLASQAERIIHALYTWLDGRQEHALEGWEKAGLVTGEVRFDPRGDAWTPLYALQAHTPEQEALVASFMHLAGCYRMRKLSPAEVWERDAGGLARLPAHVLPALIGRDLAQERRVNDRGSFLFEDASIAPEPLRYVGIAVNPRGHEVMMKDGETYLTFCNPFDTRYLLVCDARGSYIGRCLRVDRASRADDEALTMAMGQAAHVNALRARSFLARNAAQVAHRVEAEEVNAAVIAEARAVAAQAETQEQRVQATHDRIQASGDLEDMYGGVERERTDLESEQLAAADQLAKMY